MDKTISLHLNKNRRVSGTLRGYDQYMNVVLSDSVDETSHNKAVKTGNMGMIVSRLRANEFPRHFYLLVLLVS